MPTHHAETTTRVTNTDDEAIITIEVRAPRKVIENIYKIAVQTGLTGAAKVTVKERKEEEIK